MTKKRVFGEDSCFLRDEETGEVWVDATFMYNTFGGRLMNWLALAALTWDNARWIPVHVAAERLIFFPGADKESFLKQIEAH